MHPQSLMILATVGMASLTGGAVLAIDVRLDRTMISFGDVGDPIAHLQHLDPKLVARDSWIAEKGHFTKESADIRATNADAMHTDERFPVLRGERVGNIDDSERPRLF